MTSAATARGPHERSAWEHDLSCALFPAQCGGRGEAGTAERGIAPWSNDLRRQPLGDIALVELRLLPQRWWRTAGHIDRGGGQLACTVTVLQGRLRLCQEGRDVVLSDRDTSVVDGARPFMLDVEERSWVIGLVMARDLFARRCAHLSDAAAMPPLNRATADPVAAFIGRLPDALDSPELTSVESQRLGARTLDLLQLVFTPSIRTTDVRDERLTAAKTFIDDHLRDPDLCPRGVAAGTAVSIRYLHDLFRSTGETVRQRIIRRRLTLAHAELSDPRRASASISTIAADFGFKTAAHFSRCFVDLYGHTPTEVRGAIGRLDQPADPQSGREAIQP
jgi:AraC-like DNA-binding protein